MASINSNPNEFRRICEDKSKKLIVHFDGKHIVKYGISISGRNTKGVGDQLFNKIRDHWDEIIANGIDYQKLELFDWNQDEFLVQKARDSLELMEKLLDGDSEMFHRDDCPWQCWSEST